MANRLSRIRERVEDLDADAVWITSVSDTRWSCGFTGSNGLLIVGRDQAHFVTDGRYTDQAAEEVEGAEVHIADRGLVRCVDDADLLDACDRVAYQADSVSVAKRDQLADTFESIEWVAAARILARLVAVKDEAEIDRIRRSQAITEAVFDEIIEWIEPGVTEREVGAEIVYRHLKKGADSMAFDPIVASGPNAARPHARPTDRTLQRGDMVVLDMGCFRDGYASDMTRTVALGEVSFQARRGYRAVREAQDAALEAARAGLTGKELDAVARDVLSDAGYGDAFSHGLGHGIGLQVHEWPRVSRTVDEELPEGACVTIEPGVYIPDDNFGVRIEDIVVLRSDGADNLTTTSKDLLVL